MLALQVLSFQKHTKTTKLYENKTLSVWPNLSDDVVVVVLVVVVVKQKTVCFLRQPQSKNVCSEATVYLMLTVKNTDVTKSL